MIGDPDPVLIVGSDTGRALNRMAGVPMYRAIPEWRSYLAAGADEAIVKRTRERLKTGRPAGDAEFVRKLEEIAGRRLSAMPRGRPRKVVPASEHKRACFHRAKRHEFLPHFNLRGYSDRTPRVR